MVVIIRQPKKIRQQNVIRCKEMGIVFSAAGQDSDPAILFGRIGILPHV
jgi:hypothetical protein